MEAEPADQCQGHTGGTARLVRLRVQHPVLFSSTGHYFCFMANLGIFPQIIEAVYNGSAKENIASKNKEKTTGGKG